MWLLNKKQEEENIVKDLFGNDIRLDSNGDIVLKDYDIDMKTIFDDEIKKIPINNKEFLKQDRIRATRLLNETNKIL